MMQTIEILPWEKWESADGNASNIPGLISQLNNSNLSLAENALIKLKEQIGIDDFLFDSATQAIPFIADVALSCHHDILVDILKMFVSFAGGTVESQLITGSVTWKQAVREGLVYQSAIETHDVVTKEFLRFKPLLRSDSPILRSQSALFLSLIDSSEEQISFFEEMFHGEIHPSVKATYLWAIGFLCYTNNLALPKCVYTSVKGENKLVAGSAEAAVVLNTKEVDKIPVPNLVKWLKNKSEVIKDFALYDGSLHAFAKEVFYTVVVKKKQFSVLPNLMNYGELDKKQLYTIISLLFKKEDRGVTLDHFTSFQLEVLNLLSYTAVDVSWLPRFGIPASSLRTLSVYLERKESLLNYSFEGKPVWYIYSSAINEWNSCEQWNAYIQTCSVSDVFSLLNEILDRSKHYIYFPWELHGKISKRRQYHYETVENDTRFVLFWADVFSKVCSVEQLVNYTAHQTVALKASVASAIIVALANSKPETLHEMDDLFEESRGCCSRDVIDALKYASFDIQEEFFEEPDANLSFQFYKLSHRPSEDIARQAVIELSREIIPLPDYLVKEVFPAIAHLAKPVVNELFEKPAEFFEPKIYSQLKLLLSY